MYCTLEALEQQLCEQPPYPGPFNSRVLRSCLVPQYSHLPHWPAINDTLRIVTGCLRPTPADNLPILAGIQPAELRRKGTTLSLARGAIEPRHLLHSALTPIEWECRASQIETSIFTSSSTTHKFIHGRRRDFFQGGPVGDFPKDFSRVGPKVVKFGFYPSKLKK